jgi:predicted transcriptional regulator
MRNKTEETKEYKYSYKTLERFARIVVFDYQGDFKKFCLDKKALNEKGNVILYENPEVYYSKMVDGTEFFELDDFFRPNIPYAFWSELDKQSSKIQLAISEKYYEDLILQGLPDPRIEKIKEVKERLNNLGK